MTPLTCAEPAIRLSGRVVDRRSLDARTRDAMFRLLSAHFLGVDRATFERDLENKSCAILLEDDTGHLRGFSTMVAYRRRCRGKDRFSRVLGRHDC